MAGAIKQAIDEITKLRAEVEAAYTEARRLDAAGNLLRAENARLRAALEKIADCQSYLPHDILLPDDVVAFARAALADQGKG